MVRWGVRVGGNEYVSINGCEDRLEEEGDCHLVWWRLCGTRSRMERRWRPFRLHSQWGNQWSGQCWCGYESESKYKKGTDVEVDGWLLIHGHLGKFRIPILQFLTYILSTFTCCVLRLNRHFRWTTDVLGWHICILIPASTSQMTIKNDGSKPFAITPNGHFTITSPFSHTQQANQLNFWHSQPVNSTPHLKWTEIWAFGHWMLLSPHNVTPTSVMTKMYADFNHAMCSRVMPTCLTKWKSNWPGP